MTLSKQLQGALAVLVAGLVLATGCGPSSGTKGGTGATGAGANTAGSAENKPDSGPAVTVSAEQLAKDFKADPAAADKKYKGHTLIIEGKVHDVYGKEVSNEPTLVLWGYREKPTDVPKLVQCFFPADLQGELKSYKKDQQVKVKGTGSGSIDTLHYQVKDCSFVK